MKVHIEISSADGRSAGLQSGNGTYARTLESGGSVEVAHAKAISISIHPRDIVSYQRNGRDLVLKLVSGETIRLLGYFRENESEEPDLRLLSDTQALEESAGVSEHVNISFPNATEGSVQPAISISGLTGLGLVPLLAVAGLGGIAAAAAAGSNGHHRDDTDSDSDSDSDSDADSDSDSDSDSDNDTPNAPTDLEVSADGRTLTGKGQPGRVAHVYDDSGRELGSSTVGEDGRFTINLDPRRQKVRSCPLSWKI